MNTLQLKLKRTNGGIMKTYSCFILCIMMFGWQGVAAETAPRVIKELFNIPIEHSELRISLRIANEEIKSDQPFVAEAVLVNSSDR